MSWLVKFFRSAQLRKKDQLNTYKYKIMKMQSTNLFEEISKTTKDNLIAQAEETLAKGFESKTKTFGSVDLWNIHRQRKSTTIR